MEHDNPQHRTPPRAEPLQPDRPGRGLHKEDDPGRAEKSHDSNDGLSGAAEKQKEQSEAALDNVREGYGRDT